MSYTKFRELIIASAAAVTGSTSTVLGAARRFAVGQAGILATRLRLMVTTAVTTHDITLTLYKGATAVGPAVTVATANSIGDVIEKMLTTASEFYGVTDSIYRVSTAFKAGDVVRAGTGAGVEIGWGTAGYGKLYKCIVAGTSHSSAPTWPTTTGATVAETGGVTWKCLGDDPGLATIILLCAAGAAGAGAVNATLVGGVIPQ